MQLLSQLELAGEEIKDEILRGKEALTKEDSEELLSLLKNKDHSVVMKDQKAENTKVIQRDTHYMLILIELLL